MVVMFPLHSSATVASADDGGALFKAKCASCHSADGSGGNPMGQKLGVRDLRSADVQNQSDAQLSAIIANGKKKMPGFGKSLSADQIKQLVAFIRSLRK
jgi:mono/diheme cytochrome c family protein